jgi:two-component system, OmpR family, phosphate regulon sensor histidine kinase PhoR
MSGSTWLLIGVVALILGVIVYYEIARPALQLRSALGRLASGDFRPVLLKTRSGLFRKSSRKMTRLAEMLQQLDRQITDEGFSLRAILSSMVEGVLIVDRFQRIRLANDALGRMFRFAPSPINRTAIEVFRSHELQEAIAETLDRAGSRRIEISLETPGEVAGYQRRHFEVYASALNPTASGAAVGAVVVFHDITAIHELEAVRREFVANVSHEFRTPLSIINGYLETLLDGALEDREMAERSLRVMLKNSTRLTLLIEDLLTISRFEHRTEQIDFRRMNLRETFTKTLEHLEPAINERGARIYSDWQAGTEEIEGDSRRIDQVFSNLLENALRYGPRENLEISLTARREGPMVSIDFCDNGPGIPAEDQVHIFERFYRVHKDRSRGAGGTGLGLSIVKHIVQAHAGTVDLVSTPGHGTAFTICLPVSQSPQEN